MGKVQELSTKCPAVAPLLTEEEIRAYRHHRKRLARIVADQWLYTARYRLLTLRFRKERGEKLKRCSIIQWKTVVERRMRMCLIVERACVLRRFILERRSFHIWQIAVQTRQLIHKPFDRTKKIVQRSTRRRAFAALDAYSREVQYKRKQQVQVQVFWTFRLLRNSISRWCHFMHQRRLRKNKEKRAHKQWTESLLKLTLRGWKQVLISRASASITNPENPLLQVRLLTKCFWRWNLFMSQRKAKIHNTREKKLILAQRHHERKLLRAVYDGWDRARFSSRLARDVAHLSLEACAMDVALSWFVKSLVKRILVCWKQQSVIQKNHRRNHWHAIVHFKMQNVAKGLQGFRKNVELEHFKQSLQILSVESYQQRLKRKAVTGCKLLHQSKRFKSAQLEQATAQWKTAKLQEHFDQWYFATALRSMKKNQLLKSVKFSCRRLCLRGFQGWRTVTGLRKEKKSMKDTRLNRLRETIHKLKKMHILKAWKSLRKEMNIKSFNEARAVQFFFGFRAVAVVKALHVHMQEQKLKRSLLAKATKFQETKYFQRAIRILKDFVMLRELARLAADQRRRRVLKHALRALMQWRDPQGVKTTQQQSTLRETLNTYRNTCDYTRTPKASAQLDTSSIRLLSTPRAQPRRPAFLYDEADLTKGTKFRLRDGEQLTNSGNVASKNLQFVAREVEWMEQILVDYEDLKVQMVRLRAELALLLETRSYGENNDLHPRDQMHLLHDQKTLLLQQEIHSLEAKKMVQMPLIQAVLSRVQDLRTNRAPSF